MSTTPKTRKTESRQVVYVCVFLVLAVLAVFGQTASFQFVNYDDAPNVYENRVVKSGLSVPAIGWAFTHAQGANWIPLTTLSHMLDCQIFALNAGGHHLVNVLWHAINAVLLFLVLRQMTGSLWRSALVAALFAVHPLRAESVAWVSERKDVLSGFFFLLTIGAYVRQVRRPSRAGYAAVILLFGLGLLAKSMVATLPFVLLLLDYWPLRRMGNRRQFFRLVREKIPLFALAVAACAATALVPGLVIREHPLPFWERLGNAFVSYVVYLRQMVFPDGLATPYPLVKGGQPVLEVCLAVILMAVITFWTLKWRKRRPYLLTGWLWYLGMLLPVIGIVQISSDAAHADRYTYLPEIGLAVAATWAAADWTAGWKYPSAVSGGLLATLIGVLAVWGYVQTSYWRDNETLWTHSLECAPENTFALNGLGMVLRQKGELAGAIARYNEALKIKPDYATARNNLGIALRQKGDLDGAIAQYQKVLEIDPHFEEARNNLGNALVQKGDLDGAAALYRKVLETKPDYNNPAYESSHNDLGNVLYLKGNLPGAVVEYRSALEINPDYLDARNNLGVALVEGGHLDEGIAQYRAALRIDPDYVRALEGLGKALLRKEDFDEAMACFQKAASLNQGPLARSYHPGNPADTLDLGRRANLDTFASWYNLGNGFFQESNWEEAIACYRQAIKLNPLSAAVHAQLGHALLQHGQTKEAKDSLEEALKILPDQINAQNNLAWLLATTSHDALRDGAKAIALAEQANRMTGKTNPMVLQTLAAAYAEGARFGEATAAARRAQELATAQKNDPLVDKLEKEIKLYSAGAPMRDAAR